VSDTSSESPEPAYRTVVRLPSFERSVRGRLTDEEQRSLELELALHPRAGAVVPGTAKEIVFLILAYAKTERATISGAEKEQMRRLTRQLESEP
jgi:hypothetical protein